MRQNDKNSESKNTEMISMKANEYYYDFAHLFFVERDTNSVYSICKHIFNKCIEQFEQKLAEGNINCVAFHFNPQTKKIDTTFLHILFLFAMSRILYDIFAITKEDFNQLFGSNPNTLNNEANYESKNNNKTKVLSSAIWTIIQNKQQETKIVDYLYDIMCNKAQVNMQTFNNNQHGDSDNKDINDNTTEQNIKSFTYQYYLTIMAQLISDQYGKLNCDLRKSYNGILRQYFNFTNYQAWNQNWHNQYPKEVVRDVFLVYREEYYNVIIAHPDYLLNFDADECWEAWNAAYSYSNVKKEMDKNELHALILVIFKGNQNTFIRFCEGKKSSVGKLEYVDTNVRQGYRRNLILWTILFVFLMIVHLAILFLSTLFMDAPLLWLPFLSLLLLFLTPFLLVGAMATASKILDYKNQLSYSTDSKDKYDRYLKACYPILESKNNEKCSQYENFLKCSQEMEQYKADIDNQKKRPQDCTDDHSKSKYPDSEPVTDVLTNY